MRRLILCTCVMIIGLTGCGSKGGDSADGSSTLKGTGYLKIALPELPDATASAASASVGSLAQVIHEGSYAEAPSVLSAAIEDLNTEEACIGGASNIPFVICIVESLGINAPGVYEGPTPKGDQARVVVSDITGDSDGYTLQAIVTLTSSSEKVFMYKADATGRKGLIEIKPDSIFATNSPGKSAIRVAWSTTATSAQTLEYTHHYTGSSATLVSEQVSYIAAVIDGNTGIADLSSRDYMYVDNTTGYQESNAKFAQTRIGLDRVIALVSSCTDGTAPAEGVDCFAHSASSLNELVSGQPLTCGTVPTTGAILLTPKDSRPLSNSTAGSWAYTGTFSADAACESLRTSLNGGAAFTIHLDKNSSAIPTLAGINHVSRAKSYADLKLLSNVNFL